MWFTCLDITSYFSLLSLYCGDKYVGPDVSDFRSISDNCGSAVSLIYRQDSRNEESMDAGSSFSSASTMVGTLEAWVIAVTPKIPFPMEGFGNSEGGGKKTVKWSPYMGKLDSSNSSSFEHMPTENSSVVNEDRYALPVRNLVWDRTESSYVFPAVLSYISSNGGQNECELWNGDAYLYGTIIPGTYGAATSCAHWYKEMNGNCSCQECKRWCRYWWGKVTERGWNCSIMYANTH